MAISPRLHGPLALLMLVLGLDQLTKAAVLALYSQEFWPIEVLPFFNLVLVWNRGISFGMLGGGDELQRWLLTALAVGVAIGLMFWLLRTEERLCRLAFPLIAAGALGNALDRVLHGAVVDFLDFHVGGWHWPAFNVADSAIVIGAAVLIVDGLWPGRRLHTSPPDNKT